MAKGSKPEGASLEGALAPSSSSSQLSDELAKALVADVTGLHVQASEEDFIQVPVEEQGMPLYVPTAGTEEQATELDESIWKALQKRLEEVEQERKKEKRERLGPSPFRRG